ncbi:MAG: motility associated factor glycosyltransferase family protein [Brevinema sp.]
MIQIHEIITNPDDTKNLVIKQGERMIRLHSSRPLAESKKIFAQLSVSAPVYFLGGLGCGYLLEILLGRPAKCLIYEPESPILETVLTIRPELKKLLSHPQVILVRNIEELTQAIQEHKLSDLSYTINRSYNELFPEQFREVNHQLSAGIRKQSVGNATLLRFGKIWTKNIFRNMHRYFYSQKLIPYLGWAKNKAAIIVGAGPSLGDSLELLKQYQDYAVLIACDTALPILHHAKITPDFVVTVDPQEKNSLYIRYTPIKNHILIADPSVHDSTFENYKKENIILMDSIFPVYKPFEEFWGACGLLASGGSVSTSAFDFARKIEADPIIMVGQDLAFTNNKTHSTGNILTEFSRTSHHRLNSFYQTQALTTHTLHCEQIKGRKAHQSVSADARLILFRDWFSQEIPNTDATVIVAGMDGAFLTGAEHMEIPQAFSKLTAPISKKNTIKPTTISSENYRDFLNKIDTTMITLIPQCSQISSTILKASQNDNLDLALRESTKLQQLISTNAHLSLLISISIQDSVQAGLNLPSNINTKDHIALLLNIAQETLSSLKQLQHLIKKSLSFVQQ